MKLVWFLLCYLQRTCHLFWWFVTTDNLCLNNTKIIKIPIPTGLITEESSCHSFLSWKEAWFQESAEICQWAVGKGNRVQGSQQESRAFCVWTWWAFNCVAAIHNVLFPGNLNCKIKFQQGAKSLQHLFTCWWKVSLHEAGEIGFRWSLMSLPIQTILWSWDNTRLEETEVH